jgi:hypothetical protein
MYKKAAQEKYILKCKYKRCKIQKTHKYKNVSIKNINGVGP